MHRRPHRIGIGLFVCAMFAWAAQGQVIISEIMYNPASDETPPARTEWVELYNAGDAAVDVAGWHLADEDGKAEPLPAGVSIPPRTAIVLIPAECSVDAFRAAWGDGFQVFPVAGFGGGKDGMRGLGNNATAENEILTLRGSDDSVIDEVNFQSAEPWPTGKGDGPSIYLVPNALDATKNDDGASWMRSELNTRGAKNAVASDAFDGKDCGSPGTVATE